MMQPNQPQLRQQPQRLQHHVHGVRHAQVVQRVQDARRVPLAHRVVGDHLGVALCFEHHYCHQSAYYLPLLLYYLQQFGCLLRQHALHCAGCDCLNVGHGLRFCFLIAFHCDLLDDLRCAYQREPRHGAQSCARHHAHPDALHHVRHHGHHVCCVHDHHGVRLDLQVVLYARHVGCVAHHVEESCHGRHACRRQLLHVQVQQLQAYLHQIDS